jgi:hypothetical protein
MGFSLKKRIKIAPGITLNLSKSGTSVSVGQPGATVNVNADGGTKVTVGLPGSGVSYSEQLTKPKRKFGFVGYLVLALVVLFWLRDWFIS